MKNTDISITPALPEAGDSSTIVINMRNRNGRLVPAMDSPPASDVAAEYTHTDGSRSVFTINDREVVVSRGGSDTLLGTLPADFRCAAVTARSILFMTDAGPWHVDYNEAADSFTALGTKPEFPPVVIEAADAGEYHVIAPACRLDRPVERWPGTLSATDSRRITFALYSAYNRAAVKASSAGCFTAPVLVWYRITDASGNTLHRSSPVMLAPAEEYRPPRAVIKLSSGDGGYTHVLAGQVSVRAFSIAMRIAAVPDSSWARKAAAVEVYVSPAPAVVDAGADASFDFGDADGSYGTVTATLPLKHTPALATLPVIDRLETACRCIARISDPFTGGVPVMPEAARRLAFMNYDTGAGLASVMRKDPGMYPPLKGAVEAPHSFAARTALVTGDMLVWADITPVRALPQSPLVRAVKSIPAMAWTSVTRVTLRHDDGTEEIVSSIHSGSGNAPLRLSPLTAYPHPAAIRMELGVSYADGTHRHIDIPLSPSPCRRMACHLSDNCAHMDLEPCEEPLAPLSAGHPPRLAGTVLAASPSSPVDIDSTAEITCGRITAVTPAAKSSSAWDFARRHLYVFSVNGIYALSVNASRTLSSAHIIDRRGVGDARKVAVTPDGVYASALDDTLLRITASKTAALMSRCRARHLVYRPGLQELWCLMPDGRWLVLDSDRCVRYHDGSRTVSYATTFALPGQRPRSVGAVTWRVRADDCRLRAAVESDNGSRRPALINALNAAEAVHAPLRARIVTRPVRSVTLRLSGSADESMQLEEIILTLLSWTGH